MVALVMALVYVSGRGSATPHTADEALSLLSRFPHVTFPPGSEACAGPMTPTCAGAAARRADAPIAWVSLPPGYTSDGAHLMLLSGGRSLFEEALHSSRSLVSLRVGDGRPDVGARDGVVDVGGTLVTVLHHFDLGSGLGPTYDYYATWLVAGRVANLWVDSTKAYGGSAQSARADLDALLGHLHVAYPG
jgi:hypothetical protein